MRRDPWWPVTAWMIPAGMGEAWSPDGTTILTHRDADNVVVAVDTATGKSTTLPFISDGTPDWQRLAP